MKPTENDRRGCGFEVAYHDAWSMSDARGMTGLRFQFCHVENWNVQEMVEVEIGDGDFEGMKMCPYDTYIASLQVRYENYLGAGRSPGNDDTGINGLKVKCKSLDQE